MAKDQAQDVGGGAHACVPRRLIVTGEKALLFEPQSPDSKKFLEVVLQQMQLHTRQKEITLQGANGSALPNVQVNASHTEYMNR